MPKADWADWAAHLPAARQHGLAEERADPAPSRMRLRNGLPSRLPPVQMPIPETHS